MTDLQKTIIYCTRPWTVLECPKPSLILRYPNSTATDIVSKGLSEQSLIDWSQQFCSADKTFIDAGAHCGMYALSLAPFCRRVEAFECQRQTFYQLCGGIALNSQWNVYAHHVALGNEPKQVNMNIISLDGGGTTLRPRADAFEVQSVQMKTLDSYGFDDVCFLKLDVEGSEQAVLQGAKETLSRCHNPPFLFESWPNSDELHRFIREDLNYSITPIRGYEYMMLASRP